MGNYILEFFGTLVLVLFGDGVCCACSLSKTKAHNAGWVVIALGWGLAVMMGALIAGPSGGHLNPAVTLGLAVAGNFAWENVAGYIIAQMLGGFCGAVLVYLFYYDHFKATEDPAVKLGVFCTAPAIRNTWNNFFCEFIATFMLMFAILVINPFFGGSTGLVPITYVIIAIGMSLGATTGYAMNAARDLAPRIAHAVLPIPGKGSSDWSYSWIPAIAPLCGAVCASLLFGAMAGCYQ
jgi:MIP family channel proteins